MRRTLTDTVRILYKEGLRIRLHDVKHVGCECCNKRIFKYMLFGDADAIAKMVKFLGRYANEDQSSEFFGNITFRSDVELLHYWK